MTLPMAFGACWAWDSFLGPAACCLGVAGHFAMSTVLATSALVRWVAGVTTIPASFPLAMSVVSGPPFRFQLWLRCLLWFRHGVHGIWAANAAWDAVSASIWLSSLDMELENWSCWGAGVTGRRFVQRRGCLNTG